jgi:hypothetical protein
MTATKSHAAIPMRRPKRQSVIAQRLAIATCRLGNAEIPLP